MRLQINGNFDDSLLLQMVRQLFELLNRVNVQELRLFQRFVCNGLHLYQILGVLQLSVNILVILLDLCLVRIRQRLHVLLLAVSAFLHLEVLLLLCLNNFVWNRRMPVRLLLQLRHKRLVRVINSLPPLMLRLPHRVILLLAIVQDRIRHDLWLLLWLLVVVDVFISLLEHIIADLFHVGLIEILDLPFDLR